MPLSILHSKKDTVSFKPVHSDKTEKIINDVKKLMVNENCRSLTLDLSDFNFFDSIRIGTITATYHFVQFINGQIVIIVKDNLAKKTIENLKLRNTTIIISKQNKTICNIA